MKNNTDNKTSAQKNKHNTGEDEDNAKRAHTEKTNPQDKVSEDKSASTKEAKKASK